MNETHNSTEEKKSEQTPNNPCTIEEAEPKAPVSPEESVCEQNAPLEPPVIPEQRLSEALHASAVINTTQFQGEKPNVLAAKSQPTDSQKQAYPAEKSAQKKKLSDREVMERTAGLWQYREIADDGLEQHSEFHTKHTETPFAEIIAARARGKMHKRDGTNCDDYFETAATDECVIAVVCDGAGSKPLSRIGSRVSSETACAFLKAELSELFKASPEVKTALCAKMDGAEFMEGCMKVVQLVQQSAQKALDAQKDKLAELSADEKYKSVLGRAPTLSDLSATFLAAVIIPLDAERGREVFVSSVQIGDGCVCAIDSKADADSCLKLLGTPDSGAFLGETDFLSEKNTRPDVIAAKTRVSRGTSDCFLLMTDGVADDYFPANPMMKRLYLDLGLNGIIPMNGELSESEDPAPVFYSSVSMSRRSVALQYAKQLLSGSSDEAINGLWDKRDCLRAHSLEAFRMSIGDTPEECLCVWLDNYNERGSFDDRTLCVVRIK